MNTLEKLAESVLHDAIHEMAREIIEENVGYGIDTEIKSLIKQKASEMLSTDEELCNLLKEQIVYWIKSQ